MISDTICQEHGDSFRVCGKNRTTGMACFLCPSYTGRVFFCRGVPCGNRGQESAIAGLFKMEDWPLRVSQISTGHFLYKGLTQRPGMLFHYISNVSGWGLSICEIAWSAARAKSSCIAFWALADKGGGLSKLWTPRISKGSKQKSASCAFLLGPNV